MNCVGTFKYLFWVLNVHYNGEKRGQVVPIEFMVDKKVRIDEYLVGKIKKFRDKAKVNPKRIVFPESSDARILKAAQYIEKENIAIPYVLSPGNIEPKKQEEFAF